MPRPRISISEFRRLFESNAPVNAIDCVKPARALIVEAVGNEINHKPSQLIALAEYLAANLKPGPRAIEIHRLLQEAYGFVGRYEDAWQAVLKNQPQSAIPYFRFFRTVIPELAIPTEIIGLNRSREWQGQDRKTLYTILGTLLEQFEVTTGTSVFEYYCRIADRIFLVVENETGISFDHDSIPLSAVAIGRGLGVRSRATYTNFGFDVRGSVMFLPGCRTSTVLLSPHFLERGPDAISQAVLD